MSSDENKGLESLSDILERSEVCGERSDPDMDTTVNDNLLNDNSDKASDCENSDSDKTKTMKESKENKVSNGSETNKKSQILVKTGNASTDVDPSLKVGGQPADSDVKSLGKETDHVEKSSSRSSDMDISSSSDKKSEKMDDGHMEVDPAEGKLEEQASVNMSLSASSSSLTSSTSSLSSTSSSSSSSSSLRPSTRSSSSQRQSTQQTEQSPSQGRATRLSQNPDFAAKHRKFLNRVHDAISKNDDQADESSSSVSSPSAINGERSNSVDDSGKSTPKPSRSLEKRRRESVSSGKCVNDTDNEEHSVESDSTVDSPKKKKFNVKAESSLRSQLPVLEGSDRYCWRCHRDGNVILCKTCPRVYHMRCTQLEAVPQSDWVCPECTAIVYAENFDTRSAAMKSLTLEQLCNLLKYTILRMKGYVGSEWFCKAVDQTEFPEYKNFVVHPMDLMLLEKNIKQKRYGSTEAFLADTKWILHNCVVFNTYQSKLSNIAKSLVKICRQEMGEIENCPDCYLNAHTRKDSWFIEVCRRPHIIVWAKLKGFPFWPAKAMRTNNENHVDVRFFGAHDRAWVPVNSVYLYSRIPPAAAKNKKKNNLDECIMEVEQHIKKLRDRFGKFEYAPFKTGFDPENEDEQLRILLPHFTLSSNNAPLRRYSRLIGPVKSVDPGEQCENKPVEVKKEESDKKDGRKVTANIAKKILKENKSIFGENNSSDEVEPVIPAVENDSTSNKPKDSGDKSTVDVPLPVVESNEENSKSVSVIQQLQSGEPNLVFRGVTVKRQLSTVYDGGGGGDNNTTTDSSAEKSIVGKTSDETVSSVKLPRKSSDTCVSDSNSNFINRFKVLKTYQNNSKNLNKNNSDKICRTDKDLVSSDKENTEVSDKSLEVSKSSETSLIVSQNSSNSSSSDSCSNNSNVSTSLMDGNVKSVGHDEKSKSTDDSQKSKDNSISSTNIVCDVSNNDANSVSNSDKNDSSISENDINMAEPIVILCDIKHTKKDQLNNVTIKSEIISNDENIDCDNGISNLRITSVNSLSNTVSSVEKAIEDLADNNQNDIESDCSSKDDSITEIVVDKPSPETIDLDIDKSSEISVTLEDHPELILGGKPSSNVVSELHNKLMLDSTDENPLVIIDENSDAEQNQSQKELTTSISILLNSESSLTSDKEQSVHQQILKSVLDNNSENSNSTNNLEKTVLMNRRKSKPVKIRSRSNTSSSEDAVEELKRICEEQEAFRKTTETPSPTVEEVLDEVSGRFRRKENSNNEDPNVTITLISDSEEPRKPSLKVKDIRPSVALSRNVSLTVIDNNSDDRSSSISNNKNNTKDVPTSLEMECVESDTDEPVLVNETRLRPTARKTFPKPVPSLKTSNTGVNKPSKSHGKKELQITAISEQQVVPSNKVNVARLPTNLSSVDEIKISNTMSMKLQPSVNTNSAVANGRASSPPLILPNPAPNPPFRNTTTTQARVLPQLQPKPLPAAVPVDAPISGPTSLQLDNCSQKLAQRFRSMLEEMLRDLSAEGSTEATVKSLQLEMERLQWKHRQELAELKHNTDLIIMEMRASLEAEKQRLLLETKMKYEAEKESAINETKMKQWCALCKKEALFYCCWNTAYCNYPCQQAHWPQHMSVCAQTSRAASETTITKTTSVPKSLSTAFNNTSTNKTVCFSTPNSNQQANSPITSKPLHLSTSSSNNIPFIPINVPNVSTCGSSTCGPGYNRTKNSSTVISSGLHSSPGNPYYPPGMTLPQNGSTNTTQSQISHQADMKLMPPPSHHQTNISYSRMINGKMHSQGPLPPPPPLPHTAAQLHNYRHLSVSVRPPQYFMIPRGAPAGGFYH